MHKTGRVDRIGRIFMIDRTGRIERMVRMERISGRGQAGLEQLIGRVFQIAWGKQASQI